MGTSPAAAELEQLDKALERTRQNLAELEHARALVVAHGDVMTLELEPIDPAVIELKLRQPAGRLEAVLLAEAEQQRQSTRAALGRRLEQIADPIENGVGERGPAPGELPDEPEPEPAAREVPIAPTGDVDVVGLLAENIGVSRSEGERLIRGGGVKIATDDGSVAADVAMPAIALLGRTIRVGNRRYLQIVEAEPLPDAADTLDLADGVKVGDEPEPDVGPVDDRPVVDRVADLLRGTDRAMSKAELAERLDVDLAVMIGALRTPEAREKLNVQRGGFVRTRD